MRASLPFGRRMCVCVYVRAQLFLDAAVVSSVDDFSIGLTFNGIGAAPLGFYDA